MLLVSACKLPLRALTRACNSRVSCVQVCAKATLQFMELTLQGMQALESEMGLGEGVLFLCVQGAAKHLGRQTCAQSAKNHWGRS